LLLLMLVVLLLLIVLLLLLMLALLAFLMQLLLLLLLLRLLKALGSILLLVRLGWRNSRVLSRDLARWAQRLYRWIQREAWLIPPLPLRVPG